MSEPVLTAGEAPVRIGEAAPDFLARSTEGMVRLSDYRGQWLIFFSHPGDFTPVCTSEFVDLARADARFRAMGCSLLGHSVDSLFSHLGWIRTIRDQTGVVVPFPIVEDVGLAIARRYGMLAGDAPNTSSVRATFFIDPEGVVRALICYPASVGRSVEEMLRLLAALQKTAGGDCLAPSGWQPGADTLALPPMTAEAVLSSEAGDRWLCGGLEG